VPYIYTVKKGYRFSRPQPGCHVPNSTWPEINKLFPPRESLVSGILAGDGKSLTFFTVWCRIEGYSIHRVPECLSLHWNWAPPLSSSVSTPLDPKGGGAPLPCGSGEVGTQFGRLERKPGILYTVVW
jgi:hypothetical protein